MLPRLFFAVVLVFASSVMISCNSPRKAKVEQARKEAIQMEKAERDREEAIQKEKKQQAEEISRLIAADRDWQSGIAARSAAMNANSTTLGFAPQRTSPLVLLSYYTEVHRSLDLRQFPREFQMAYLEHLQAWEKLQAELRTETTGDGALQVVLGVIATASQIGASVGVPMILEGISQSEQARNAKKTAENSVSAAVIDAWHKLEQSALGCGAQITGHIERGYLGVVMDPVMKKDNVWGKTGILIRQVEPNTPAQKAGLQEGDLITEFNGQTSVDMLHLRWRIALSLPHTRVILGVIRNGYELQKTATVAPRPPQQPQ